MGITDSLTVPKLVCAELWRRYSRKIRTTPFYRWRYSGQMPEGISYAPIDLRPAKKDLANNYYAGQFTFAQTAISTQSDSPFAITPPNEDWAIELHSFRWLRHMRAADTNLIRAGSLALISDWIDLWDKKFGSHAWEPEVTAARIIAWLSHTPPLSNNSQSPPRTTILKSLGRQVRFLQHNAAFVEDGYPRLITAIALAYSSLCLTGNEKTIAVATQNLDKEISRQILPDGGHISRSPIELVNLLADLLPLSQIYVDRGYAPSPSLLSAIDRMMGALRFFQHSNGQLAHFNGTGETPATLLKRILQFGDAKTDILRSAPHSGFERLAKSNTVVLIDTGNPNTREATQRTMAGTLSFELSSGNNRFITNCGAPEYGFDLYAPFARATAAHSTATISDTSSSKFAGRSKFHSLLPTPLISYPKNTPVKHQATDEEQLIFASHDGYVKSFNVIHSRHLNLSHDGNLLSGIDQFTSSDAGPCRAGKVAVRFHLPPKISASLLSSGQSILLAAQNGDAWSFTCENCPIKLEESILFSGPGQPRKSLQIVIYLNLLENNSVHWSFSKRNKQPQTRGAKKKVQQETPDLLDQLDTPKPKKKNAPADLPPH